MTVRALRRYSAVLCIGAFLARAAAASAYELPNVAITPGVVDATNETVLSPAVVCRTGFARSRRHRYDSQWLRYRAAMFAAYHIPRARWSQYTVDHLVPIELGGRPFGVRSGPAGRSWDLRNVWPEPKTEAKEKDAVEDALHRAVCSRRGYRGLHLSLPQADAAIARDWTKTAVGLPSPRRSHAQRDSYYTSSGRDNAVDTGGDVVF